MIEFIFGTIIISLIIKNYADENRHQLERDKFIKALMAKNLSEYEASTTIKEPSEPAAPPDIPLEEADSTLFEKHLKSIVNGSSKDREYTE